jgi:hypothetical protein
MRPVFFSFDEDFDFPIHATCAACLILPIYDFSSSLLSE